MDAATPPHPQTSPVRRSGTRRLVRGCAWGCGGMLLVFGLLVGVLILFLSGVPKSYPLAAQPIPPPPQSAHLGGGLDGFDSPYLGHTGSWDGKGGAMFGASKIPDMDKERAMGLRWTFMPVYWRAMEPNGPIDPARELPPAWQALDRFVIAAHERGLNILMQAPVVGGNAGGPPEWAGRREKGKSAPANMQALANFAGKLAARYRPGGALAQREGWGANYGVRAWELDNEPESYFTCWKGQGADYAEFATLAAQQIKTADPQAVIVAPGMAAGKHGLEWLRATLDASANCGSPAFREAGRAFSIGPVADVISFHNYEGLDSAFTDGDRTITQVFSDVRAVFEESEQRAPGFTFARKQDYWHTEGSFDFLGILSAERRAAWRFQFFTRAFAAGIRKVVVMDASRPEQIAVRAYVEALPNPFPMLPANDVIAIQHGQAIAFRHPDGPNAEAGQTWIIWSLAGGDGAVVEIPVRRERVKVVFVEGKSEIIAAKDGRLRIDLGGDVKMPPPVIVIDGLTEADH